MSQVERLTRLSEILVELFRSPVPTHFFQTLGDQAFAAVPNDYLAVCLLDPEKGGYVTHSLAALEGCQVSQRVFSGNEGLPGWTISTGKARLVADLAVEDGVHDLEGVLIAAGMRAVMVAPIRRGSDVLGALLFAGRPPITYGDDDLHIAQLLAAGLSAALETSLAYQAAADERSTLGAVLASTADAVIMMNQAGLVLLANTAVRPMLGLVPDTITGRPLLEVVDYAPLRELFVAGRPGISDLPLPDGRVAQASLVAVTTPFGEPVGLAAILRDITLLKNLEQMKNDFVNTVSHDLKGPITVIAGMADLMRIAGPADENHATRCQDIRDTAQHMADLVTDLLDIGKIEAGLDSNREPMDLIPVVGEALRIVKPRAETKSIELRAELPEEAIVSAVPADVDQPRRQRRQVHPGRRARDDRGRDFVGWGGSRYRHDPGRRHRVGHPRPRPAARLREVLSGQEPGDSRDRRDRPRARHHQEYRRGIRRPDRRRERRARRHDVRGRAAARSVLTLR